MANRAGAKPPSDSRLQSYVRGGGEEVEGWLRAGAVQLIVALDRAQRQRGVRGDIPIEASLELPAGPVAHREVMPNKEIPGAN